MSRKLLAVNEAECTLWSIFAKTAQVGSYTVLFDPGTPKSVFANVAYPHVISRAPSRAEVLALKDFYEGHGCVGHLRDYSGALFDAAKSVEHIYYWEPGPGSQDQVSDRLTRSMFAKDDLRSFARGVGRCFGFSDAFCKEFASRMQRASEEVPSKFFGFCQGGDLVAVASLFEARNGLSALMNMGVMPELRHQGFSLEIMRHLMAFQSSAIFLRTEHPLLIEKVLPKVGFEFLGRASTFSIRELARSL